MHMLDEIRSQPDGIRRTIDLNLATAAAIRDDARHRGNLALALLVGRGTSDNACTYAKYVLALVNGLPAGLAAPSLLNLYEAPLRLDQALVVAVSQSGETDEVVQALEYARARGAMTVAITNEEASTLARSADHALVCRSGRELSIPATKTYTAELTAAALLAVVLADRQDLLDELRRVPDEVARLLDELDPLIERRVERYRYMDRCTVLGRGLNYATALEAALKLKETCALSAEPLSAADFLHGPIAALAPNHPVIVFAPSDPTLPSLRGMLDRLEDYNSEILAVSDDDGVLKRATLAMPVRTDLPSLFWPFGAIVPVQLLACRLALAKGLDPDKPAGLSKVTHSGRKAVTAS